MNVRAKFTCVSVHPFDSGGNVKLEPVVGGSEENDSFFKYTPWGRLEMGTINQAAFDAFQVGQAYFIDISRANEKDVP